MIDQLPDYPSETDRIFPLGPLLVAAKVPTLNQLALKVRAGLPAIRRADLEGLTWPQADVWACRLGCHPAEVWSDWWAQVNPEEEEAA